jgi:hypothetical protein
VLSDSLNSFGPLLGYIGLGPDQSLIPYFLAMLAWAGTALGAVVWVPLTRILRRLRRGSVAGQTTPSPEAATVVGPESSGEASQLPT